MTFLKNLSSKGSSSPHLALATCYHKLGEFGKALSHVQEAVKADRDDPEARWLQELLSRQDRVSKWMQEMNSQLPIQSMPLQMPEPIQVGCS